jgi:hypothetical protein
MSDWFFMLGESLSDSEREHVREYLRALGIEDDMPVVGVYDWDAARRAISFPQWDRRWWDAEQAEKRRLFQIAIDNMSEHDLLAALSHAIERITETVHGAAAVEAARLGCADAGLIRAAAGAASEALYLAELARLAGESEGHPFRRKQALFAGGHWPLGIVSGRYHVF